ncbi:MAG: enoyl-CoA hydratase/isomerase family protein, partial [Rubrivivax sp.]|nr:enoyl-CoA hydratase/isomerase family protein [Pyrinomonadaceae bacterium]
MRLNRPEKRNALTRYMIERLSDLFRWLSNQSEVRAVILSGEGKTFCAGTDIAELESLDEEGARRKAARGQEMCDAIEMCGTPVIAAVSGAASGGGCELALACHLRVAAT